MAEVTMAIVALIPGLLGRRMNRLRKWLDPDERESMPAHVPLVPPFRAQPSFLPLEQHCWRVCHETAPLAVGLGELVLDDEKGAARFEVVAGQEQLAVLRSGLITGKYAPPSGEAIGVPLAIVGPVTCRDGLALTQWEEFTEKSDLSFSMERVELMAQYPDGTWYQREFFTLDRAVTRV